MTGRSSDDAAAAQWLAALAGQPDVQADGRLNRQAAALRQALQQRSRQLDPEVRHFGEQGYGDRLRSRDFRTDGCGAAPRANP